MQQRRAPKPPPKLADKRCAPRTAAGRVVVRRACGGARQRQRHQRAAQAHVVGPAVRSELR
jgi:hypothetical protein